MRLSPAILVALGGARGAATRWAIVTRGPGLWENLPLTVLFINMAGCALLGLLLGRGITEQPRLLLGVGFCGGLTTFSTFAVDTAGLFQERLFDEAWSLLAFSIIGGLVAFLLGRKIGKQLA